jgi:YD repeat-containing protein
VRPSEGVDIVLVSAGQYKLGYSREGEWMKYTINATTSGTFTFNARVASPNTNSKIHAEIDGVDVTGPMVINNTGGWNSWQTISKSGISLTAGQHVLKVVLDQRSTQEQWVADIDWFSLTLDSSTMPQATLDVYTSTDGLGRVVQARAEAEDTTKQRITGTFYHPSGQAAKETVPYLATLIAPQLTPAPQFDLSDNTPNANSLTNTGGTAVTASLPFAGSSYAIDFNGTNAYAEVADNPSLDLTNAFTIEFWLKPDSNPSTNAVHTYVAKSDGLQGNAAYMVYSYNDGGTNKLVLSVSNNGSWIAGTYDALLITHTPTIGEWHHYAVTWNGSTKTAKFYRDGSQIGTDQVGSNVSTVYNSSLPLRIGARSDTVEWPYDGKEDDVRVWNVVRSGSQINDYKGVELTGTESGLVAYYPMETLKAIALATPYGTPDASAKNTQFTYDAINRMTTVTNTKGGVKTIVYDHWKETTIDEKAHLKHHYRNAFGKGSALHVMLS